MILLQISSLIMATEGVAAVKEVVVVENEVIVDEEADAMRTGGVG